MQQDTHSQRTNMSTSNAAKLENDYFGLHTRPQLFTPLADWYESEKFGFMHDEEYAETINNVLEEMISEGELSEREIEEIKAWQKQMFKGASDDVLNVPTLLDGEDEIDAFYRELIAESKMKPEKGDGIQ